VSSQKKRIHADAKLRKIGVRLYVDARLNHGSKLAKANLAHWFCFCCGVKCVKVLYVFCGGQLRTSELRAAVTFALPL
jgi:hypothetical protein